MLTQAEWIQKAIDKCAKPEELIALVMGLKGSDQPGFARTQLSLVRGIEELAYKHHAPTIGGLADIIITEQIAKVEAYGDRAFPLSEKQIGVIIRAHFIYLKQDFGKL